MQLVHILCEHPIVTTKGICLLHFPQFPGETLLSSLGGGGGAIPNSFLLRASVSSLSTSLSTKSGIGLLQLHLTSSKLSAFFINLKAQ